MMALGNNASTQQMLLVIIGCVVGCFGNLRTLSRLRLNRHETLPSITSGLCSRSTKFGAGGCGWGRILS